ncbi:MAG: lipoyl synthase [Oxalobacter sp.]|nr:lipoyl synthase [Oxalobacter sp.]
MTEEEVQEKKIVLHPRQKGAGKTAHIPIPIEPSAKLPKPPWLKVRAGRYASHFNQVKDLLVGNQLITVCEEASCPNKGECYGSGTAAFMILGDRCTRRCPFCDVAHGIPMPPDPNEPETLAEVVAQLGLTHVVITSVNRDDLPDGGASHFIACQRAIRVRSPMTRIEVLTPDFRRKVKEALAGFAKEPPDIFNHNLETVSRLYPQSRPGADYEGSLNLLKAFGDKCPDVPRKSGLMVGLGETDEEILQTIRDLYHHGVRMLTIGQYLQPSKHHLPVRRYVAPATFDWYKEQALDIGFDFVASAPLVRSSYHAGHQAEYVLENKVGS